MQREDETRRGRVNDDQAFNLLFSNPLKDSTITSKFGFGWFSAFYRSASLYVQFLVMGNRLFRNEASKGQS